MRYTIYMNRTISGTIAAFVFLATLLVPSTANAAWHDGRTRDGLFISATVAETQLGWGKYAPPSMRQAGPSCTAYATGNALRILLVKQFNWSKDLKWQLSSHLVYQQAGKNPRKVAEYANWPGYQITGSHTGYATSFFTEIPASKAGITEALNRGPVAFAVDASTALLAIDDQPHEIVAVYADWRGVLIFNSWGAGWLKTGFAWIDWSYVDDYAHRDFTHVFWGIDRY